MRAMWRRRQRLNVAGAGNVARMRRDSWASARNGAPQNASAALPLDGRDRQKADRAPLRGRDRVAPQHRLERVIHGARGLSAGTAVERERRAREVTAEARGQRDCQ